MLNKYKLMSASLENQKITDVRKRLSIELCDNFTKRLNPAQNKETKIGALIAIKNFIKESKIDDPILLSFLADTISDPDNEVRTYVIKTIKEIANNGFIKKEAVELLEIKMKEVSDEIQEEIIDLLKILKD